MRACVCACLSVLLTRMLSVCVCMCVCVWTCVCMGAHLRMGGAGSLRPGAVAAAVAVRVWMIPPQSPPQHQTRLIGCVNVCLSVLLTHMPSLSLSLSLSVCVCVCVCVCVATCACMCKGRSPCTCTHAQHLCICVTQFLSNASELSAIARAHTPPYTHPPTRARTHTHPRAHAPLLPNPRVVLNRSR